MCVCEKGSSSKRKRQMHHASCIINSDLNTRMYMYMYSTEYCTLLNENYARPSSLMRAVVCICTCTCTLCCCWYVFESGTCERGRGTTRVSCGSMFIHFSFVKKEVWFGEKVRGYGMCVCLHVVGWVR